MKETTKNALILIFKYLLGLLFLVSGIAKLFPIESFELTLVSQKIVGWELAPYLSRCVIAFELFLGFSFFQDNFIKKFSLPASFLLLLIFNIHLIYTIAIGDSAKNCGCFGEILPMTSVEALVKNIFLMVIIIYLFILLKKEQKGTPAIPAALFAIAFAWVFIIFPVKKYVIPTSENGMEQEEGIAETNDAIEIVEYDADSVELKIKQELVKKQSDTTVAEPTETIEEIKTYPKRRSIFSSYMNFSNGVTTNLDEGIKIVALFSLDCEHCMETAREFIQKKGESKLPDVFILFFGTERQVEPFFEFAGGSFPFTILPPQEFFPLLSSSPPRVCLLNNGNILLDMDSNSEIVKEIEKFLSKN